MAKENRDWGYRRIQGALANLGHEVARGTIANILREHGLEPAPEQERKTTWKEFLSRQREVIAAADFFTIEAWTRKGLTRFLVFFLIDLSSRRVQVAGVTRDANRLWMSQMGRNLSDVRKASRSESAILSMTRIRCSAPSSCRPWGAQEWNPLRCRPARRI